MSGSEGYERQIRLHILNSNKSGICSLVCLSIMTLIISEYLLNDVVAKMQLHVLCCVAEGDLSDTESELAKVVICKVGGTRDSRSGSWQEGDRFMKPLFTKPKCSTVEIIYASHVCVTSSCE